MKVSIFRAMLGLCAVCAVLNVNPAGAVPIKLTYTGNLANGGSLDGVSFGAVDFTIVLEADTDNVANPTSFLTIIEDIANAQVTLDGVGTVTANGFSDIGIVDFISSDDFIGFFIGIDPDAGVPFALDRIGLRLPGSSPDPLLGYAFDTNLLVTGDFEISNQGAIQTSGGALILNDADPVAGAFEVQVVPLPAAAPFFVAGLAGLGLVRRRRRKA